MDNLLGSRIKILREENKLTQNDLAKKLGFKNYTTITKWEKGENFPRGRELKLLAELFDVSSDWILGLSDSRSSSDINHIYSQLTSQRQHKVYTYAEYQLDEQNNIHEDSSIYLVGQTAAGEPLEYSQLNAEQIQTIVPHGADYALTVKGNSMEPLIKDGSIIFYKEQPTVENGEIAIVELNSNEVTCKKLYLYEDRVVLKSINEKYEDIVVEDDVRIIGKVIM